MTAAPVPLGDAMGRPEAADGLARRLPPAAPAACAAGVAFIHRRASQGVTTKAIANDNTMPMLALMGIGLM